jgi:branched-chain amino acid transport system substrate-binding protein
MRASKSLAVALATTVVVGLALAGCSSSPTTTPPTVPAPVPGLVAVEGPMTGSQSATGIDMYRGAQLAAAQINAAGGVDGVKLHLVQADDAALPATGVTVAKQMVKQGVFGVVGPFNSGVGVDNLSIYRAAGDPIVRLTSAHQTQGFGVTTQPMDVQVAPVEAKELTEQLHATRVAIVYDTSAYTASIATQLKGLLTTAGHPPVTFASVQDNQTNFDTVLATVKAAHPDVVYIAAYGTVAGDIAKQAAQLAVGGRCFVDLAAQGPDFVAAATVPVAQTCLNSGVPSAQQFTGAANYVSQYQSTFQADPGTWGTFTYDSVELLAKSVAAAGGWKQAATRTQLSHTVNLVGITGAISIDPATGNRVNAPVVILDIDATGNYVIDPTWAASSGFSLPGQ